MKPGISTTEFWMTMINTVLQAILAFGLITSEDFDQIGALAAPLVAGVLPVILYIYSRTKVKIAGDS